MTRDKRFFLFMAIVMGVHAIALCLRPGSAFILGHFNKKDPLVIQIQKLEKIRVLGSKKSKLKSSPTFIAKGKGQDSSLRKSLSFKDLMAQASGRQIKKEKNVTATPLSRPGLLPSKPKALNGLHFKGREMMEASQGTSISGSGHIDGLDTSAVSMNIEIPKGIEPDEMNEYELKYYSFIRRGSIKYINTVMKELRSFQRKNPHLRFPMTELKQTMTGRLTYDKDGNLKQIKMVRWTKVEKLQEFFENVLKDLDKFQNPPEALWARDGEFSLYITLHVNASPNG